MNLVIAELQRLWARRMTRFFPLILGLLIVVGMVIAFFVMRANDFEPDFVNDLASSDSTGDGPATGILGPISSIIPLMGFVIGASFIGADLKVGMIEHLLTWEPRRLRLVAARLVAGAATLFVLTVLLCIFLIVMLYGLSALRGTTDGTTAELWGDIATAVLRAGVSGAIFFMMGVGVTILVNNSLGSIVGFVIYWFIIEGFLLEAFLPAVVKYLPVKNASAFADGVRVTTAEGFFSSDGPSFNEHHDYLVAGLILFGWGIGLTLVGSAVFRHRDVA